MNGRTEKEVLKDFLKNSPEFAQMKTQAKKCPPKMAYPDDDFVAEFLGDPSLMQGTKIYPEQEVIDKIENSNSFADILQATKTFDLANSDYCRDRCLGPIFLFFMKSAGHNRATFFSYTSAFRDEAIQEMENHKFKVKL